MTQSTLVPSPAPRHAPLHIGVAGARGRMGRAVSQVLEQRSDALVALRFDRTDEAPDLARCDVVIDFSTPDASAALAARAAADGRPALVIGSTGLTDAQHEAIVQASQRVPIVLSGNFSLGVNVLVGLVRQAAAMLGPDAFDIEVVEAHHRRKVDAPSGTALMLGEAAAAGRGQTLAGLRAPVRDGVQDPRETGSIGFSALRGGGIVGEHAVVFAGEDEILTLSHSARDRSLFARGAVEAAVWVAGRAPGLYDMQDVLGFGRP
jgi:4-hydroxy-tetrahydrodipicolinate reductase